MGYSILNVTVDCADGERLARFWSELLGWPWSRQEMPGNPFWLVGDPDGVATRLVFVQVREPKTGKNRVHVDVVASGDSPGSDLDRILALGATVVDDRRGRTPGGWVVLADPEGNEFCLENA